MFHNLPVAKRGYYTHNFVHNVSCNCVALQVLGKIASSNSTLAFTWKVMHQASFWKRRSRKLGNSLVYWRWLHVRMYIAQGATRRIRISLKMLEHVLTIVFLKLCSSNEQDTTFRKPWHLLNWSKTLMLKIKEALHTPWEQPSSNLYLKHLNLSSSY